MEKTSTDMERILKALANRRRLAVVKYLHKTGGAVVGDVASEIKLSFTSTSKHLRILHASNIVDSEQSGTLVKYYLINPRSPVLQAVLSLG